MTGPDPLLDDPPGSDGEVVRRLLAGYAAGYEPDTGGIEARLADAQLAWLAGVEPVGARRRYPRRLRQVGLGLTAVAAAAAVLALVGLPRSGVDTVAGPAAAPASSSLPPSSVSSPSSVSPSTTVGPASTVDPPPVDAGAVPPSSSSATTVGAPPAVTVSTAPSGAGPVPTALPGSGATPSTGTTPGPVDPGGAITVDDLPSGLTLSANGYLAWAVAGARNDGVVVRLITHPSAVTVTGPSPAARPAPGPMNLTWANGLPEQTRATNRSWWSAPAGPAVFTATVDGTLGAGEIALYAGGTAPVQATVTVDGFASRRIDLPATGSGSAGVVTLVVGEAARGRTVTIVLGAPAGSGTVCLAAVTAR